MNEVKQKKTVQKWLILAAFVTFLLLVSQLLVSHISFQTRALGFMTPAAAAELGILDVSGPFGPTSVWFALTKDNKFEYRSAYPLIGVVPFDYFGSGVTSIDLLTACNRLGNGKCHVEHQRELEGQYHE